MDRSSGFGSTARYLKRPIQTRFRFGYAPQALNLATYGNSLAHYAKGTPSLHLKEASTACRQTVSGSISLPYKGFFSPFPHGTVSLSVTGEYLAFADGPAGFKQGSTCPALLGCLQREISWFRLRGYHPLWPDFPVRSTTIRFCNSPP